jgi:hypothetical protein
METICSYEWDDVDAGVLCRHLGMGMSGRATYLPRDWSFVRADNIVYIIKPYPMYTTFQSYRHIST